MVVTASTVATIFVENVIYHTLSRPTLRLETMDGRLTVAVHDGSPQLPVRREHANGSADVVSGLAIVAAITSGILAMTNTSRPNANASAHT